MVAHLLSLALGAAVVRQWSAVSATRSHERATGARTRYTGYARRRPQQQGRRTLWSWMTSTRCFSARVRCTHCVPLSLRLCGVVPLSLLSPSTCTRSPPLLPTPAPWCSHHRHHQWVGSRLDMPGSSRRCPTPHPNSTTLLSRSQSPPAARGTSKPPPPSQGPPCRVLRLRGDPPEVL